MPWQPWRPGTNLPLITWQSQLHMTVIMLTCHKAVVLPYYLLWSQWTSCLPLGGFMSDKIKLVPSNLHCLQSALFPYISRPTLHWAIYQPSCNNHLASLQPLPPTAVSQPSHVRPRRPVAWTGQAAYPNFGLWPYIIVSAPTHSQGGWLGQIITWDDCKPIMVLLEPPSLSRLWIIEHHP